MGNKCFENVDYLKHFVLICIEIKHTHELKQEMIEDLFLENQNC